MTDPELAAYRVELVATLLRADVRHYTFGELAPGAACAPPPLPPYSPPSVAPAPEAPRRSVALPPAEEAAPAPLEGNAVSAMVARDSTGRPEGQARASEMSHDDATAPAVPSARPARPEGHAARPEGHARPEGQARASEMSHDDATASAVPSARPARPEGHAARPEGHARASDTSNDVTAPAAPATWWSTFFGGGRNATSAAASESATAMGAPATWWSTFFGGGRNATSAAASDNATTTGAPPAEGASAAGVPRAAAPLQGGSSISSSGSSAARAAEPLPLIPGGSSSSTSVLVARARLAKATRAQHERLARPRFVRGRQPGEPLALISRDCAYPWGSARAHDREVRALDSSA